MNLRKMFNQKSIRIFMAMIMTGACLAVLTTAHCGIEEPKVTAEQANTTATYVYNSTTNKGDLVTYTVTGSDATVNWAVTDAVGDIDFTVNLTATCGAEDALYAYRTCTIASGVTCTPGNLSACPGNLPSGGETFDVMEVPGTVIIVHVPAATTGGGEELHVGMISGGCPTDVSGDYAYIRVGDAASVSDVFGLYHSDASFLNITHADFGFSSLLADMSDAAVTYNSGGNETFTDGGCSNGVYTRTMATNTLRANLTSSGLFVLDMPSGQGGLISLKTSSAATLADLANKSWAGIAFTNGVVPELVSATTAAAGATSIDFSATLSNSGISTATAMPVSDTTLAAKFAAPVSYSGNSLATTFAAPKDIPGLFELTTGNSGSSVIIASKLSSGEVLFFGTTYNFRDTTTGLTGCTVGSAGCDLRISGNFLLFSR